MDRHILLVDDDAVSRKVVRQYLLRGLPEARIAEAADGAEAVKALKGARFDCVIVDYLLPDVTGAEFVRVLRQVDPRTPVVALTGHGNEEVAVEMMKAGAADYLSKVGLTPQSLCSVVDRVLARGAVR